MAKLPTAQTEDLSRGTWRGSLLPRVHQLVKKTFLTSWRAARKTGRRVSSCTAAVSPGPRLAAAPGRRAMDADHHVSTFVHRQRHLRPLVRTRRIFQPHRPSRAAAAPGHAGLGPEQRHPIAIPSAVAASAHGRIQRHSVISHRDSPSPDPFAGLCRKPAVSSYAARSAQVLNLQIHPGHVII